MSATSGLASTHSATVVACTSRQGAPSGPDGGQERLWHPVADRSLAPAVASRGIVPGKYRALLLDNRKLRDVLARAPLAGTKGANPTEVVIDLPWPDGSFRRFRIEKSPIMESRIAALLPAIETFRGQGVDDRTETVRFDRTPEGMHATILSGEDTVHLDPFPPTGDMQHHIVYFQRDQTILAAESCRCAMTGEQMIGRSARNPAANQERDNRSVVASTSVHSSSAPIDEISVEWRAFGYRCAYKLTFRRDGTAARTIYRGAAKGAADRLCRATVTPEQFAALAHLVQTEGFFDLKDVYLDSRLVDGVGARTTVVRDSRRKTVAHRDEVGPPNLKAIEDAIDAVGRSVAWTEIWPLRP